MGKNDTLNPLDGSLDGETETSDKFSAKYGRRASRSKPKTALQTLDGRMEDRTSNQEYLSNLDGERQASAVECSIGCTTGFHNHGEGPYYGLLLVESAY